MIKLRREHSNRSVGTRRSRQLLLLFNLLVGQGAGTRIDRETLAAEDAALDREIKAAEAAHPEAARRRRQRKARTAGWQTRGIERQVHMASLLATRA